MLKRKMKKFLAGLLAGVMMLVSFVSFGDIDNFFNDISVNALSMTYTPSSSYKSGSYYSRLLAVNLTGNQRQDLVNVACSQIGYHEGNSNNDLSGGSSGTGNYTEYGYWFGLQDAWCAMFIAWCANQAGISTSIIEKQAQASEKKASDSTGYFGNTFHSFSSYTPQIGDIAYIDTNADGVSNHVEIVVSVSNGTITTVGGNTLGSIKVGTHSLSASTGGTSTFKIIGYECPNYSGTSTVTDTQAPTISNVSITDQSATGYTVTCTVTDDVGISQVLFPTWTTNNDQDDIIWASGTASGNTYSYRVNISDHNNELGEYNTHIYAYDSGGNVTGYPCNTIYIENENPVISDVTVKNISVSGYTVTCTITDNVGVNYVTFPTWTDNNGQDDIVWGEGSVSGNTYTYKVKTSSHNNETGVYHTHIYAYDSCGNVTGYPLDITVQDEEAVISNVTITDQTVEGYTVNCTVTDDAGISQVLFPTWTSKNDQDDIIWGQGNVSGNTYSYRVNTSDHNGELGTYNTHIYAYDSGGNVTGYPCAIYLEDETPVITDVEVTNVSVNGYTVKCTITDNIGVNYVTFPTWTDSDGQDDIIWGEGSFSGNTYTYKVKTSSHNNETGIYHTHIYAYDACGNVTGYPVEITIEDEAPLISNVSIFDITATGYTVTCKVTDDVGIDQVLFPTWTASDDQDDIIWGEGTDNGDGTYTYKVKTSDHNNETGVYNTHIYAYDSYGNITGYPCEAIYLSLEAPTVTVEAKSTSSIEVNWDAIDGATCYRIDRRQYGADAYETIATVSSSTTYTDTGLSAGTGYYYRVYAVNDGVVSEKQSGVGTYTLEATTTTTTSITTITTTTTTTTTTTAVIVTTSSTNSTTTTTKSTEATTTTSTEMDLLTGDINLDGDVRLEDSVILNKYVAGLVNLSDLAYSNADTNADDYVDADDALVLLKFQVGLVNSLPAEAG